MIYLFNSRKAQRHRAQYMTGPKVTTLETLKEYHDFIQQDKVVIKVGSETCTPSHVQEEKFNDLDKDRLKDVKFGKVDAEASELADLFEEMGVRNLPTLILYKKGRIITMSSGIKAGWQLYELFAAFNEPEEKEENKEATE